MGGIKPRSPHRQIAQLMREHIEMGLYPPGKRMPSLEKLADLHQVTKGVIRNALALLRLEGVICARNGDGHYVIPNPEQGDSEYARLMNATLAVVHTTGASSQEIAERTGVSRWHIQRMLGGGRPLSIEWFCKIIEAAIAIGREKTP